MDLSKIDDQWLIVLVAMMGEVGFEIKCPHVNTKRRAMALPLRQARKIRGLKKISVYDDLTKSYEPIRFINLTKPRPIQILAPGFDLTSMSDDEVRIWYAISSQIVDYSCLGRDIRSYVEAVYLAASNELEYRNLSLSNCDLFDMTLLEVEK